MKTLLVLVMVVAFCARSATPTFGAITAAGASPNSATVSVTITGGVSQQIQASVNGFFTHIDTPWFPVAASAVAAQLQPNTAYTVRVVACDATVTAWGSCAGNLGTSSTAAIATTVRMPYFDPLVLTLGSTVSYNSSQFGNGKYTDGDVNSVGCMANGVCVFGAGDGRGPQDVLAGTGERNIHISSVNSGFTTIALVNSMDDFGTSNQLNIPGCWSDNTASKPASIFAQGNTLLMMLYRVNGSGQPVSRWIQRSEDGGATWFRPGHTSGQSSATGDPPCAANTMWNGIDKVGLPRFLQVGVGGAVTNPKDGIDAYWYITTRDVGNTFTYLMRCYKSLNPQVDTNWEGNTGGAGNDANLPANWTTSLASMAPIETITSALYDLTLQYVPDARRFMATGEVVLGANDFRIAMKDATSITGPYLLRYSEPTTPPFNVAQNKMLLRAWPHIFWPSYSLTSSNPTTVTFKLWHYGVYPQNRLTGDPANNWYSPQQVATTVVTQQSLFPMPGAVMRTR